MEKKELLLILMAILTIMAISLFFLYRSYQPIEGVEGSEAAARLIIRTFILYGVIMMFTVLALLVAFWVEIYVLKPKYDLQKVNAQEWVVKGEVEIQGEISKMKNYLLSGNIPAAEGCYKKALDVYNWLQDYEMSERKKQDYYLQLDKARTELEEGRRMTGPA